MAEAKMFSGQIVVTADALYGGTVSAYISEREVSSNIPSIEIGVGDHEGQGLVFISVREFRDWVVKVEEQLATPLTTTT